MDHNSQQLSKEDFLEMTAKPKAAPLAKLSFDIGAQNSHSESDCPSEHVESEEEDLASLVDQVNAFFRITSAPKQADITSLWQNRDEMFHLGRIGDETRLACGKFINEHHEAVSVVHFLVPRCKTCFGEAGNIEAL